MLREKKRQYQARLASGKVTEEDYYAVAVSGANLELCHIPDFQKNSPLFSSIEGLLRGDNISLEPPIKSSDDFEEGLIEPATHPVAPTSQYFNIDFFNKPAFYSNLFVMYFTSLCPSKDVCYIFCTNLFPDIPLLQNMTNHKVTVIGVDAK